MSAPSPTADLVVAFDSDSAFYWDGAADGRLLAQRCAVCERLWHPPGPVCPHCQALDWSIADLPLSGELYSVAEIHEPGSPIQGTNYLVALAEFTDQHGGPPVRIAANLRGASLAEATIGAAVTVHFEALAGGRALPQFQLAAERGQ
jgi:uncharacterized OB-fold protein